MVINNRNYVIFLSNQTLKIPDQNRRLTFFHIRFNNDMNNCQQYNGSSIAVELRFNFIIWVEKWDKFWHCSGGTGWGPESSLEVYTWRQKVTWYAISNQHVIMVWHLIHTKVEHHRTRRFVMLLTATVIFMFIFKEGAVPHYYSFRYIHHLESLIS